MPKSGIFQHLGRKEWLRPPTHSLTWFAYRQLMLHDEQYDIQIYVCVCVCVKVEYQSEVVGKYWRPRNLLTCFSKAAGTRRLSSDRLLLMRSLRRFSMTCQTGNICIINASSNNNECLDRDSSIL